MSGTTANVTTTVQTAGLDRLIASSAQAVQAAHADANAQIVALARSLVRVRTGATRDSIHATPEGEVVAGGAALFLEFGFHDRGGGFHGPYPFLRPAWDAVFPQVPHFVVTRLGELMVGTGGLLAR